MKISWFERLVGKENISDEIIDREVYSTDGSRIQGKTSKIVWVTNAEQVHQIVLYARRNAISIVPRGAGTSPVGSAIPFDALVIDFTNMNKTEHIGKDFITVEPGIICEEVNKVLKDKFFPIIPEDAAVCTIGGMCGVNSSSIYQKRFGKMKDFVLEVDMIDGHGRLRKYGNEVIGTEGILGIITKVKLRIINKITERSMDLLKFDKIQGAIEKIFATLNNQEAIAVDYIGQYPASLIGLEKKYHLIVEYIGLEGHIKDHTDMERIEKIRKNIFNKLASQDFVYREDPFIPNENIAEFLYWLESRNIPVFGLLLVCIKENVFL